jgi:acyl dehydratase
MTGSRHVQEAVRGVATPSTLSADLSPGVVGLRFKTEDRTVSDHDVRLFADLTGDWHPQHVDERWAATSPFGERIAHGMLVVSFAMGLVPVDPRRVVALRRCEAVFRQPVRLGERIHVEGRLSAVRPIDHHHVLASWRWGVVANARDLAARLRVDVLWRNLGGTNDDPYDPRIRGVLPL